jgi:hypothetical protein
VGGRTWLWVGLQAARGRGLGRTSSSEPGLHQVRTLAWGNPGPVGFCGNRRQVYCLPACLPLGAPGGLTLQGRVLSKHPLPPAWPR